MYGPSYSFDLVGRVGDDQSQITEGHTVVFVFGGMGIPERESDSRATPHHRSIDATINRNSTSIMYVLA